MASVCLTSACRSRSSSCCSASIARGFELDFFGVDQLELLVEDVGAFVEPSLLFAKVAADSIDLGLEIFTPFEDLLLGGQLGVASGSSRPRALALARICSARPRGLRPQPRDQVRARQPDQHTRKQPDETAQGNSSRSRCDLIANMADRAINHSGGAGEKGCGRRQRLKRSAKGLRHR